MDITDPIGIVLEGAKKEGLPHGISDKVAKEYGCEPDPKKKKQNNGNKKETK